MALSIQRLPSVLKERGRSRSSHYKDIEDGLFTRPVRIGLRAVGWPSNETGAINAASIAGMNDDEVRELVIELEAKRKTLANKVEVE